MDGKYHGRFMYHELFLSIIDILFASIDDINCSAEGNSFSAYLLFALVFIYPLEMINSNKPPQGFPQRITLEYVKTQVQYMIKCVTNMATIVACHPRPQSPLKSLCTQVVSASFASIFLREKKIRYIYIPRRSAITNGGQPARHDF